MSGSRICHTTRSRRLNRAEGKDKLVLAHSFHIWQPLEVNQAGAYLFKSSLVFPMLASKIYLEKKQKNIEKIENI